MSKHQGLAIEVRLLTGRYAAAGFADRAVAEWPPHPARLYSAMVAVHKEDGEDEDEKNALLAFEALGAPEICAPSATNREGVVHYVPVNSDAWFSFSEQEKRYNRLGYARAKVEKLKSEDAAPKSIAAVEKDIEKDLDISKLKPLSSSLLNVFPDQHIKKERLFPSVTAESDSVVYVWRDAEIDRDLNSALDELLGRIARLGHSSSFVSCRVVSSDYAAEMTYVPDDEGDIEIRAFGPGQMNALEDEYKQRMASGISYVYSLPYSRQNYREPDDASHRPVLPNTAGEWLTFEFKERHLPITKSLAVARAFRGGVLRYSNDPVSSEISGHYPDGRPVTKPHIGFLPLPNVGNEYGDGRLMGIAAFIPHNVGSEAREALILAFAAWSADDSAYSSHPMRLTLGKAGVIHARLISDDDRGVLAALRKSSWGGTSRVWLSSTPIVLSKQTNKRDVSQGIHWQKMKQFLAESCEHVGLPRPQLIRIGPSPLVRGSEPVQRFPAYKSRKHGRPRKMVHAMIEFAEPVPRPNRTRGRQVRRNGADAPRSL